MAVSSEQQRAVRSFLDAARTGVSALSLEGEAGAGKTTIWRSACESAAADGFRVLSARPGPAEVSLAFAVLTELLEPVRLAELGVLPAVQRDALNAVLRRASSRPRAVDQRVVGTALRSVLEHLAQDAPLLMAIDDLQWSDTPSRTVLTFAARRLSGRIGVLTAVRTDREDTGQLATLGHVEADQRLRVRPMGIDALTTVVSERLGRALPRPTMARITDISGGNPFYALELARAVADDPQYLRTALPDSLATVVRNRVGDLDDGVRAMLLAAASAAEPTVDLLASATGLSPAEVVDVLEDAEEAAIVDIVGPRVVFTHPLLANGVYAAASEASRRSMHRRLAASVDQPELRARHLARAATSHDPATLDALDSAAETLRAHGAPAAAAELLEQALVIGGDDPLRRLRAAEHHFRSGELQRAQEHLDRLLSHVGAGAVRSSVLLLLAAVEAYSASMPVAVDYLIAALADAQDDRARLLALRYLVPITLLEGDFAAGAGYAGDAVTVADEVGSPGLRSQALALWVFARFLHGMGVDREALASALADEEPDIEGAVTSQASAVAAIVTAWEGRLEEAHTALTALELRLVDRGVEIDLLAAAGHKAMTELWLGRSPAAAVTAEGALQRARAMGGHLVMASALHMVAAVAAHTGDVDRARDTAHEAVAAAHECGSRWLAIGPVTTLGFLEVSLGRYAAALDVLAPSLADFDADHGTEIIVGGFLPDAIEALCALDRHAEAQPLIEALLRNGVRLDRPWMSAVGMRGQAASAAAAGDLEGALIHAQGALVYHDRLPMPFERARTLLLLGQVQRRLRRRKAAAATLDEAWRIFTDIGASLWAARADTERQAIRVAPTPSDTLTAGEAVIAELAAGGMTNREIAAELFLSVKAVENTLSRIYRKLGIRSRAELGRRLAS